MLGFRNLEAEIKATSKMREDGGWRLNRLKDSHPYRQGNLQGPWRECGGFREAAPQFFTQLQLHLVA